MTSFNINGPIKMPQVTEAQNMMNNGGGGNTGYMESGGKKKKKKEEESLDASILEVNGEDKFEHSEVEYEDDDDYYGRNSIDEPKNGTPAEEKEEIILNPDNIKNKFLGLIGKITAPKKEETPQDTYSSGDFLTFSKNKNKE